MFERGLDVPQILQINATIIAGVLILMTVGSFNQPNPHLTGTAFKTINQWVAFALIPFVISSLCAIIISYGMESEKWIRGLATITYAGMVGGFIYVGWLVILIATSM